MIAGAAGKFAVLHKGDAVVATRRKERKKMRARRVGKTCYSVQTLYDNDEQNDRKFHEFGQNGEEKRRLRRFNDAMTMMTGCEYGLCKCMRKS